MDACFFSIAFHELSKYELSKIYNARNHMYGANFKLTLCTLWAHVETFSLTFSQISREYLESSLNVSEMPPGPIDFTGPIPWWGQFFSASKQNYHCFPR